MNIYKQVLSNEQMTLLRSIMSRSKLTYESAVFYDQEHRISAHSTKNCTNKDFALTTADILNLITTCAEIEKLYVSYRLRNKDITTYELTGRWVCQATHRYYSETVVTASENLIDALFEMLRKLIDKKWIPTDTCPECQGLGYQLYTYKDGEGIEHRMNGACPTCGYKGLVPRKTHEE